MVGKWISLLLLCKLFSLPALPQVSDAEMALLKRLDSVKNSASVSRHFAGLYLHVTGTAVSFFLNKKDREKSFIQRLETRFADFFFRSTESYALHHAIPAEWRDYFADSSLSPLQYKLLGINAHINGDIWQAMITEFSLPEIREGRRSYFEFEKGLAGEYRNFYHESFDSSTKVRLLHSLTMGLDKIYGQLMLARWRMRQMHLAVLYYSDPDKFREKLGRLQQKMKHIDHMILQHL